MHSTTLTFVLITFIALLSLLTFTTALPLSQTQDNKAFLHLFLPHDDQRSLDFRGFIFPNLCSRWSSFEEFHVHHGGECSLTDQGSLKCQLHEIDAEGDGNSTSRTVTPWPQRELWELENRERVSEQREGHNVKRLWDQVEANLEGENINMSWETRLGN